MVNEEEKDLDKEEGSKREDHPLSPADWIMFLSGEIYDEKNTTGSDNTTVPIFALFVAVAFSIMALMFATISSDLTDETVKDILIRLKFGFYIVAISYFIYMAYLFLWVRPKAQKRIDALEKIKSRILGRDLKEYDEIYKQYKSAKELK